MGDVSRFITALFALLILFPTLEVRAERTKVPAEGTVYIRVYGSVHGDIRDRGIRIGTVDIDNQIVGSGTGFVISEHGYVLTNHHVVADRSIDSPKDKDELVRIVANVKITKIEVCPSAAAQPAFGLRNPCVEAPIYFADVTADLAVLYIGGSGRPYLALGDSDALDQGERVQVLGYPFGARFEAGHEITIFSDVPAMVNVSGSISAVRKTEDDGEKLLQVDANVNPGNSGGPVVDTNGYVVGVIQSKLMNASGVGFAVPVNRVKDFLEVHLLDQLLPSRRLRPGPLEAFEAKGISLKLPEGMTDASPFRPQIMAESVAAGIALHIDRIYSPLPTSEFVDSLLSGRILEPFTYTSGVKKRESGPVVSGRATGINADKKEVGIYFAILNLGQEKIVARYVSPAEAIAFNARVLGDSLASLEVRSLITGPPPPIETITWAVPDSVQTAFPMPVGWVLEPRGPACGAVSSIRGQASPPQDFTVGLRVAVINGAGVTPAQAASACSANRTSLGEASYTLRQNWFAVSYVIEGVFLTLAPDRLLQIEAIGPGEQIVYVHNLLAKWAEKLSRPEASQ